MATPLRRTRTGFTLIELLVVVAIIAILLSILLPSLRLAREAARAAVCGQKLRDMGTAMATYFTENQDWIPGVNTSGLGLRRVEGLWSEYNRPYVPVQAFDWITPIMNPSTELKAGWVDRFHEIITEFHCPSQRTYKASLWSGTQLPAGIENELEKRDWMPLSYLMPVHFQFWGFDYRQDGPRPTVMARHKRYNNVYLYPKVVPLNESGGEENPGWEAYHRTYKSMVTQVGAAADKIAACDATRYLTDLEVLDFDATPVPTYFGSFTTSGAWWSGSTALGVRQGSRNWNDTPVARGSLSEGRNLELSYRHGPQRGAGLSGSCHENKGQINALFFDGSVRRLGDRESRNPVYWYPRGSEVNTSVSYSELMTQDLGPGDRIP